MKYIVHIIGRNVIECLWYIMCTDLSVYISPYIYTLYTIYIHYTHLFACVPAGLCSPGYPETI